MQYQQESLVLSYYSLLKSKGELTVKQFRDFLTEKYSGWRYEEVTNDLESKNFDWTVISEN